jgi:VWFA-related protein
VTLRIYQGALLAVVAWTTAVLPAQTPDPARTSSPDVRVMITSPQAGDYVSGSTRLAADISPATDVASANFFMNGTEVCVIRSAPYVCTWDAGRGIRDHQVRLVVTLKDGRRLPPVILRTLGLPFADTSEVDGVQVTVTVTNDGKFVPGLPRSAFRIWEDARPQTITSFVSEDVPLELIVAVDVSGSMAEAMPQLKSAVKEFLVAVPEKNQVTVMGFSDYVITVARKTTNAAERLRAVDRLSALGATSLYDAIARGIETLGLQVGRKALVVFTDGEDQGSQLTIEEVEQRLQASDVTLYMIGQGRGISAEPLKKVMQRLADPTGGRALFTDSIGKLQSAFAELLVELSHQYLLGYQSTNTARDGTYRELRVEVEGPGRVRARKGYVAAKDKN